MMHGFVIAIASTLLLQAPPSLQAPTTTAPLLLDGRCEGNEWRSAAPWRLMIEIRALGADKKGSTQFPAKASTDDPSTWAIVSLDN